VQYQKLLYLRLIFSEAVVKALHYQAHELVVFHSVLVREAIVLNALEQTVVEQSLLQQAKVLRMNYQISSCFQRFSANLRLFSPRQLA